MRRCFAAGLAVAALLPAAPASPHHSFTVAFDEQRPVSIEGVITEVKWENPHTWVYVEAKDASG